MYKKIIPTAESRFSCADRSETQGMGLSWGRLNASLFFPGAKMGRLFINNPWLLQASPLCDPWVELLEKIYTKLLEKVNTEDPGHEG